MKCRITLILLIYSFGFSLVSGQMLQGQDTLVGNEWIKFGQPYYKFSVDADGVYRIPFDVISAAGISPSPGSHFRLYSMGRQIPIFVSTEGEFGSDDFVEFYGYMNRGEMDRYLYQKPDEDMLQPEYSLYTDARPYYLTVDGDEPPLRINQLVNTVTNPPSAEGFLWHREGLSFHSTHNDPYFNVSGGGAVSYSSYMHGEGFGRFSESSSTTQVMTSHRAVGGPDAILRLRLTTTNLVSHQLVISWNGIALDTFYLQHIGIRDTSYAIPLSQVMDVNQLTITSLLPLSRHSLVNIDLTYPRTPIYNGLQETRFSLSPGGPTSYVVVDGFQHQAVPPFIYSADGRYRMEGAINGNDQVHFVWPQPIGGSELYVFHPGTTIRTVDALVRIDFIDYTQDDTEYIIITHPSLMEMGMESEYAQYRISAVGGSYRAKAYSIFDIYEQFGYGIEKHPQSIRNFVEFFDRHWPSAQMVFIIGRAVEYNRSRDAGGTWEPVFFVPTFGRPGADNLLVARNWDLVPRYPVGRLAVTDRETIRLYLNKIREHDQATATGQTLQEKGWLKNVIHLTGGKDVGEQVQFKDIMGSLAKDLSESDFGANISFFQKESTDIIGESLSKQIEKLINDGSSIINYLGHSSTSTFEFNIIEPTEWNNTGRYPVFSAMGCSAGAIHNNVHSLSDRYVLIPNKGAIAFISGSGGQFPNALIAWARPWYNHIGNLAYGATIGESIIFGLKGVSNFVDIQHSGINAHRFLLEQQTLQGDPAIRLHPLPGPDYILDRQRVSISPAVLSTTLDSFDITFSILNIGRNLRQTVDYTISMRMGDGQIVELRSASAFLGLYETKLTVRLPLLTQGKSGIFRLLIEVDPDNAIQELPLPDAENNNKLRDNFGVEGIEIYVADNLISAAYPPDFSIVTEVSPQLVATSGNAFGPPQNIVAELDTTALFNSPSLVNIKFVNHPGTLKWSPTINWKADQVYYWRVSLDSISPAQGYVWSTRSFIYKPGTPRGWNQSHFHQLTDNTLNQITPDSIYHQFRFERATQNFSIINRVHNTETGIFPLMLVDNVIHAAYFTGFRTQNVHAFVVAIDSVTGKIMLNPNPGLYGSFNHLSFDAPCFAYRTDLPESRQAMINFIENIIPDGYYVFVYTYQRPGYMDYFPEQWASDEDIFGKSIFSVIEDQYPSSGIRSLAETGSVPYLVLFQKGRWGLEEHIAMSTADAVSINWDSGISLSKGRYTSTRIGPAARWESIQWHSDEWIGNEENTRLSAWALSTDLLDTFRITHHLTSTDTIISGIDASAYPYLQLSLETADSSTYKPLPIGYWRVLYDGYPEFVIHTETPFEFIADTLLRGATMKLSTFVENVSDIPVDSLPVSLRIIGADNTTEELLTSLSPVAGQSVSPVVFEKSTAAFSGDYQVLLEVNPNRQVREFNYDNNIGILPMHVVDDRINPVLDVTFDGYHILDGDLVASKPLILIQLLDENSFLRLEDTGSFVLFLQYPSDLQPRRIPFSADWVKFIPASPSGKNIAFVELRPDLTEDGIYSLQVRAMDASGNDSGDHQYKISFEVINAESISHLYNYPNPFSTSTRFVYTLTGQGSPPFYKIQILSIAGRVVREITQDEMGPLAVGTHMTEFVWDGTDEYGNRLAAGTYLYRMIVKNSDKEDFDRYATSRDSLFKKGWGKLVIIR